MTTPWSRGFIVVWLPTPKIYDRRSRLLELLDDRFGVLRFVVADDAVTAVLRSGVELTAGLQHLSVHSLLAGDALDEAGSMSKIVDLVASELEPQPLRCRFAFQHLIAWPEGAPDTPEVAFPAGAQAMLPDLAADLDVIDAAILFDGVRSDGRPFQVEFGVVEEAQAPLRLGRQLGRATGHRPAQHDLIMNLDYPTIGTFVDSTWPIELGDDWDGDLAQFMHDELVRSDSEADSLALRLHDHVTTPIKVKEER